MVSDCVIKVFLKSQRVKILHLCCLWHTEGKTLDFLWAGRGAAGPQCLCALLCVLLASDLYSAHLHQSSHELPPVAAAGSDVLWCQRHSENTNDCSAC
jgi:hypothetical protein